jgi:hypothetical protein
MHGKHLACIDKTNNLQYNDFVAYFDRLVCKIDVVHNSLQIKKRLLGAEMKKDTRLNVLSDWHTFASMPVASNVILWAFAAM